MALLFTGCSGGTGEHHWILAEELFHNKQFKASLRQFQKTIEADPKSQIGQKAYLRKAEIKEVYLNNPKGAVKDYKQFILRSTNGNLILQAQKKIADIEYLKLQNYKMAIHSYKKLYNYKPKLPLQDFYIFRIGKSFYYLYDFANAQKYFEQLVEQFPNSNLIYRSIFELGNTLYTNGKYKQAIKNYKKVIRLSDDKRLKIMAKYGIASSYEERNELDRAYRLFDEIKNQYPNKMAIIVKMRHVLKRKISSKR